MRALLLSILVGTLACVRRGPELREFTAIPANAAAAIVSADQALFAFPVETRQQFEWPTGLSDLTLDKYAWGITVLTADTSFLPGGQAYRSAHPAPFASLQAALSAASPGLLFNPGGHAQMLDERARVSMHVSGGRVIVILHDAAQVRRVFRSHPRTVRFGVVAPLEPTWRETIVNVEYRVP